MHIQYCAKFIQWGYNHNILIFLPLPPLFSFIFAIVPSNFHPSEIPPHLPSPTISSPLQSISSNLSIHPTSLRWEAVQLPVAELSEEVCPERRAGATPQHAPEEPQQAPVGHLSRLSAHIIVLKCKHLGNICLYPLSSVSPDPLTPFALKTQPSGESC